METQIPITQWEAPTRVYALSTGRAPETADDSQLGESGMRPLLYCSVLFKLFSLQNILFFSSCFHKKEDKEVFHSMLAIETGQPTLLFFWTPKVLCHSPRVPTGKCLFGERFGFRKDHLGHRRFPAGCLFSSQVLWDVAMRLTAVTDDGLDGLNTYNGLCAPVQQIPSSICVYQGGKYILPGEEFHTTEILDLLCRSQTTQYQPDNSPNKRTFDFR